MEKWIEHLVDTETPVATERVEDADTAIKHELEDMRYAQKAGLTTTKPETTFEETWNTIGDVWCDPPCPNSREAGEHEDDDKEYPELGKLSEDEEPGWVMGTISKTAEYRMDHVWH